MIFLIKNSDFFSEWLDVNETKEDEKSIYIWCVHLIKSTFSSSHVFLLIDLIYEFIVDL